MDTVIERQRDVPVVHDVDVAVAGGGVAGVIAALAAARNGATTLIADRFGSFGGNMGPGYWAGGSVHFAISENNNTVTPLDGAVVNERGLGGIPEELIARVMRRRLNAEQFEEAKRTHFAEAGFRMGGDYFFDSHAVAYEAFKMLEKADVRMMLSCYVADPIVEDNKVCGFFVETKSGRLAVRAKVVIDATGDADIAFRAGAAIKRVAADPGIGLMYAIDHVDWDRFQTALVANGELSDSDRRWMQDVLNAELQYDKHGLDSLVPYARRAWERGEYRIVQTIGDFGRVVTRSFKPPTRGIVRSRAETNGRIDPGDAAQVSLVEQRVREYIFEAARFFRNYLPGFEGSRLLIVAPFLGARGGRWIDAVYPIGADDVAAGAKFDDVLYVYHDSRKETGTDIPYRSLIPTTLDGLIAAGRSAVPRSPNFRVRYSLLLMGQAAGVAAALCVRDNVEPRDLDHRKVQRVLVELGCPIGDNARLQELGLA